MKLCAMPVNMVFRIQCSTSDLKALITGTKHEVKELNAICGTSQGGA